VRDADSTIYLFGTFHALKKGTQWRTPKVEAALKQSSEVWLELADIGTPEGEAAAMPLIQRLGLDPHAAAVVQAQRARERQARQRGG
jgi:uncharacterized protein YbaP (TraB family)